MEKLSMRPDTFPQPQSGDDTGKLYAPEAPSTGSWSVPAPVEGGEDRKDTKRNSG